MIALNSEEARSLRFSIDFGLHTRIESVARRCTYLGSVLNEFVCAYDESMYMQNGSLCYNTCCHCTITYELALLMPFIVEPSVCMCRSRSQCLSKDIIIETHRLKHFQSIRLNTQLLSLALAIAM